MMNTPFILPLAHVGGIGHAGDGLLALAIIGALILIVTSSKEAK